MSRDKPEVPTWLTVFLDRDGVLDVAPRVLRRSWSKWKWLPGAKEAVVRLNQPGIKICICTNQPWVGLGVLSRRALDALHADLLEDVRAAGGRIDRIEAATLAFGRRHKPRSGMLDDAAAALGSDPARTFMVGDNLKDAKAAQGHGCKAILVATTHSAATLRDGLARKGITAEVVPDLASAVDFILTASAKSP